MVSRAIPKRELPPVAALGSPHQLYSLDGASLDHLSLLSHGRTFSSARERGHHCSGRLHFGNDRSHKKYFAPLARASPSVNETAIPTMPIVSEIRAP